MSNNPSKKKTRNGDDDGDEVEQLLRAAQDDMLLKLSTNSHIARGSAIDPDLDRRFRALKNPTALPTQTPKITGSDGSSAAGDEDLFARFAALKSSITSRYNDKLDNSSNTESCSVNQQLKLAAEQENAEEGDEVEKVIKWAIDAARLDPSPPSDDDDDDDDDEFDNDKSGDDVDHNYGRKTRRK